MAHRKGAPRTTGSGRRKGTPNKSTADIKALAQVHGPEAIKKLATLMRDAKSEAVQREAARDLLDRGYGKPALVVTGPDGGPIEFRIKTARAELEGRLAGLAERVRTAEVPGKPE
jgi:hypothetical protein